MKYSLILFILLLACNRINPEENKFNKQNSKPDSLQIVLDTRIREMLTLNDILNSSINTDIVNYIRIDSIEVQEFIYEDSVRVQVTSRDSVIYDKSYKIIKPLKKK